MLKFICCLKIIFNIYNLQHRLSLGEGKGKRNNIYLSLTMPHTLNTEVCDAFFLSSLMWSLGGRDYGIEGAHIQIQLQHLTALGPWTSHVMPLSLTFTHGLLQGRNEILQVKHLAQGLTHKHQLLYQQGQGQSEVSKALVSSAEFQGVHKQLSNEDK